MPTRRPRIGLNMALTGVSKAPTGKLLIGTAYIDAIAGAGGLPVPLAPQADVGLLAELLDGLDGICFIGGPDYLPAHYGGRVQRAEELMDERRDRFDCALARQVLEETSLPILGVCGGQQLLSISLGGALVQDLRTEWKPHASQAPLPHAGGAPAEKGSYRYRHAARLEADSLLERVVAAAPGTFLVNSEHHQAVRPDAIGAGLRASAWAPDGVVEALEPAPDSAFAKAGRFLLGVQWHPERMQEEEAQRRIFRALIEAAQRSA